MCPVGQAPAYYRAYWLSVVLTTQSRADLVKSGRKTSTIEYVVGAVLSAAAAAVFILLMK